MALPALNGIALCAGVGMLDEGVRIACEHLGFGYRTVCYVEREAPAAAQLVTLMEAGIIDPAPVWSDLVTFRARDWRGKVDCLTAGFPCQPHSVAGKRAGLDDERWIWPDIARLIGDLGVRFVWLENVPGLASSGGLGACLADLARLGFDAEVGRLSAGAVGASHQRERLFIFAWLAHSGLPYSELQQRDDGAEYQGSGNKLGHSLSSGHNRRKEVSLWTTIERAAAERPECDMGYTSLDGRHEGRTESTRQQGRPDSTGPGSAMADPSSQGPQRPELSGTRDRDRGGQEAHGSVSELCGPFAPGPDDPRWAGIIDRLPILAPAIEPGICGMADGLALVVDESRTDQLRAIGNGVVALTAACAYVLLARRAGMITRPPEALVRAVNAIEPLPDQGRPELVGVRGDGYSVPPR